MPETAGVCSLRRQAFGLLGDYVAAGREPGGFNTGHELVAKVRLRLSCTVVLELG